MNSEIRDLIQDIEAGVKTALSELASPTSDAGVVELRSAIERAQARLRRMDVDIDRARIAGYVPR